MCDAAVIAAAPPPSIMGAFGIFEVICFVRLPTIIEEAALRAKFREIGTSALSLQLVGYFGSTRVVGIVI